MTGYRLYSIDGAGKIVGAEWLRAQNDGEAIGLARALTKSGKCELWKRTKFVQSIEASKGESCGEPTI